MQNPPPNQQGYGYGNQYGTTPSNAPLTSRPGGGGGPSGKTSMGLDGNIAAMLCYLLMPVCCLGLILSLVLFFTEKENRFVRFHAMQTILSFAAAFVIGIVIGILGLLLSVIHLGVLMLLLRGLVSLIFLALWVFLAIKAYQGERYKLPAIGDMAENIAGQ